MALESPSLDGGESLEVDQGRTNLRLGMGSTPTTEISRREVTSAAEHILVFPNFGAKAKLALTFWYRAFGIDNRVARLNCQIGVEDWERDWPEPYLFSKIIRCFAYPIKKCWLVTKKALFVFGRFLRKRLCISLERGHTDRDIESKRPEGEEEVEAPEESSPEIPVSKAKNEFRRFLRKMFSDAARVEEIMRDIDIWEDGR